MNKLRRKLTPRALICHWHKRPGKQCDDLLIRIRLFLNGGWLVTESLQSHLGGNWTKVLRALQQLLLRPTTNSQAFLTKMSQIKCQVQYFMHLPAVSAARSRWPLVMSVLLTIHYDLLLFILKSSLIECTKKSQTTCTFPIESYGKQVLKLWVLW